MRFPALQGLHSFLHVALTKEINKPHTQKLTVRGAIQQGWRWQEHFKVPLKSLPHLRGTGNFPMRCFSYSGIFSSKKKSAQGSRNEMQTSVTLAILNMFQDCWWECKLVQPLWRTVKKLKIELTYDPSIPLPGILYTQKRWKLQFKKIHTPQCSKQHCLQ